MILTIQSFGQTNVPPALYIHVGIGYGTNAEPLLCVPIRIGEPIAVTNGNSCVLTGTIEQLGTNLVAKNLKWWKNGGSQYSGYGGSLTLEKPVFGGAVGDFVRPAWIIVSTNQDDKPTLERLKEIEKNRQKKDSSQ